MNLQKGNKLKVLVFVIQISYVGKKRNKYDFNMYNFRNKFNCLYKYDINQDLNFSIESYS